MTFGLCDCVEVFPSVGIFGPGSECTSAFINHSNLLRSLVSYAEYRLGFVYWPSGALGSWEDTSSLWYNHARPSETMQMKPPNCLVALWNGLCCPGKTSRGAAIFGNASLAALGRNDLSIYSTSAPSSSSSILGLPTYIVHSVGLFF